MFNYLLHLFVCVAADARRRRFGLRAAAASSILPSSVSLNSMWNVCRNEKHIGIPIMSLISVKKVSFNSDDAVLLLQRAMVNLKCLDAIRKRKQSQNINLPLNLFIISLVPLLAPSADDL